MGEIKKENAIQAKQENKARWGKFLLPAAFAAGVGAAAMSCGDEKGSGKNSVPAEETQTCSVPEPVCIEQAISALVKVNGDALLIGDYRVRLTDTKEQNWDQAAVIDILDFCDNAVAGSSDGIPEGGSLVFQIPDKNIEIEVSVSSVTVMDPKSARLTATMRCVIPDGG